MLTYKRDDSAQRFTSALLYLYNTFPLALGDSTQTLVQALSRTSQCLQEKFPPGREQNQPAHKARQQEIRSNCKHEHVDLLLSNMRYCKDCLIV